MQPVALLLHGNSGRSEDLSVFAPILESKGYKVLNPDLPLHGKNREFGPALTIDNCAKHFADLLAPYRDRPITLVGFSDGANIVLKLLQLNLPTVTQVVLISPNSRANEIPRAWRFLFWLSRIALFTVPYMPVFRRIYRRIGMMTKYHLDLSLMKVPAKAVLFYAEHDLILKSDQERIAKALGLIPRIIEGVDHFSILGSPILRTVINEELS